MCSADRTAEAHAELSSPAEAAAVLRQARALVAHAGAAPALMAGKQLALLSPDAGDAAAQEFMAAAKALGARVSHVRAGLDDHSSSAQVEATARMLGQLYDAVECQHLPPELVARIARSAGVPVFTGLALPSHPTAALAASLDGDATAALKRRCVLQATLLVRLG
ncbi:ornithine carbamoyltransferase [Roseateles sp. BYS87W]|uniref:Ornithine carbamoyltransferase n=1 Tax=Pelomonas baiyunensis TaxID=3299026 RepID=A0ABW7GVV4_9BURK